MDKNRMQKLAGINEGKSFKNGRFMLQRWDVGQYNYHGVPSSGGKWCESTDVSELENLARQMYEALNNLVQTMDKLPDHTAASPRVWDAYHVVKKVIKKAESL